MIGLSLLIGASLIAVGIGGYVLSGMVSPTALIPAVFGVVIVMLGAYGREQTRRRTAMHLAMGIALVGVLGSITGVFALLSWAAGDRSGGLPLAPLSKTVMATLLVTYLVMGIRSFIAARRR
ncbi:MAG TPA: hypothetical protein VES67_18085 [Vicinamibacterales bacterium]|nr:hypothetical protein [Vicinamibacterales bacterium]